MLWKCFTASVQQQSLWLSETAKYLACNLQEALLWWQRLWSVSSQILDGTLRSSDKNGVRLKSLCARCCNCHVDCLLLCIHSAFLQVLTLLTVYACKTQQAHQRKYSFYSYLQFLVERDSSAMRMKPCFLAAKQEHGWEETFKQYDVSKYRARLLPYLPIIAEIQMLFRDLVKLISGAHPALATLGTLHHQHLVPLQHVLEVR